MPKKSVSINSVVRVRYVESRKRVFEPKEGDWCLAAWSGDGAYYKGQIIEIREDGDYWIRFPPYGEGLAEWRNVYHRLSDLPRGAKLDFYLYKDYDEILDRQRAGESRETANEWLVYRNIASENYCSLEATVDRVIELDKRKKNQNDERKEADEEQSEETDC